MAMRVAARSGTLVLAVAAFAAAMAASPPIGNVEAGRLKAEAERCHECHGAQGQGDGHTNADARFAKLAGQHASYLLMQLQRYRSGQRKHDVMQLNTRDLDDQDLRDLSAYYASLAPMRAEQTAGDPAPARRLFSEGDATRGITACATCHGPGGAGTAPVQPQVPLLAGQDPRYLELQLHDWRSSWRTESTPGLMNQVTRHLTDAEIKGLASYLSGQSISGQSIEALRADAQKQNGP
ncbi:c-type cytochrome [Piscinibacter sp. HJYY11]|uniref:c-type cytochrome n=1 Tax=Piscinibacter sp. HJYY11 TaxID=2801333 RepID=UPI00191F45DA|nr:c-type cytochrome [Piscinibacter sp. HJYY11]MBL0727783.1 c-type cytochrome [Piscinibacter sp. HJYY11]